MVAIIKTAHGVRAPFFYNENKVEDGVARCLAAENFPLPLNEMEQIHRLAMLLKTATKNENVKRNAVHISLNFAPGEQLSQGLLKTIAKEYMDQIGFGKQPYLIYEHMDAGHPHLHLVSVKVRPDGSRIDTQNIGKKLSEPARKMLETKYRLVKAEDHRQSLFQIKPLDAERLQYGKTDTRRAIYNVLYAILKNYRYTSLMELNAVLRLYNVSAERGDKNSRTHQHKGLFYRVLDSDGNPVGVPIKASLFPGKPTLKFLESRFTVNDTLRGPHKVRLRDAIDRILYKPRGSLQTLKDELKNQRIDTVVRKNQQGVPYGITFVDHQAKCVWNGSDLGKQYSIKGLLERLHRPLQQRSGLQLKPGEKMPAGTAATGQQTHTAPIAEGKENSLLEALLAQEYGADYLPAHLKKQKRKKKKNLGNRL